MEINDIYEEFFRRVSRSQAFSRYCDEVFGIDLSQDGFADKDQLDFLIEYLGLDADDRCLDLGCGNGRISDYLNKSTRASMEGIDYSPSAIEYARVLAKANSGIRFSIGDINDLRIPKGSFTAAVSIDTIYFSDDYEKTLQCLYDGISAGGRIGIFYSDFVFEKERQTGKIGLGETKLAQILEKKKWDWTGVDFTDGHFELMKRKRRVSEKYRAALEAEGNAWLFDKVHAESSPEDYPKEEFVKFTNRYLYRIRRF